ncbi:MAG: histidinol-phosphate transaminase [Betaproteobacteria bacterium]|nr:MAG: histidinol-phosphate transaminase [Betaproteobacteria bacterium]
MSTPDRARAPDIQAWITRVVREDIRALSGYHVADSAGMIKLDAMENPYGLPEELRRELGELAAGAALNRYPDPRAAELRSMLRVTMGVPAGMDLLLGNGSDEIIQLLALVCARPGATVLGVEPSFVMFPLVARVCGLAYVGVPLASDFGLDVDAVLCAMQAHRPALAFLAYPNNPTGNLFDGRDIERIVTYAPGLVVVDEAYHPFAQASFMPRLTDFPNLLVMRTLSKLGLAGLRLGMLAGRPEWLEQLDKVRLPYNVNVLTQRVASHVLRHGAMLEKQAAAIRAERARLRNRLDELHGVQTFPSDANFIMFKLEAAADVFEALKQRGVLIKNLTGSHPALEDCLRVTVGTPDENDVFLRALRASLEALRSSHA